MHREALRLSAEVQAALEAQKPIVALDSTVVAHEIPQPQNLEVALALQHVVRENGAVPAMIAVLDGELKVGLSDDELGAIAARTGILKAGERDLPMMAVRRLNATATVSAGVAIAAAAGIRVLVSSGIGGVGPNATTDLDISADLTALARHSCMVVCSGTKSFMDVSGTLEYLETQRVPVVVCGAEYFPAFYARSSGLKAEWWTHEPGEVASFFAARLRMGLEGGMVIAVPVPEADALPAEIIQTAVEKALARARAQGISGKAVTPFVFSAIDEETRGRSIAANVALIKHNTQVGAQIAAALAAR